MTERLHFHFSLSCIGEGNGHPLQCSCLENPRDGGACWAAVYGVTESRTWLKRLSSSSSRQCIKKQRHHFADEGLSSQSYVFSRSQEWMWELDHKESWVPKNWCFLIVVLEKTLESPLDYKEIKPVNPKGNQSWIFIGRTDAETEASILWPPDVKNQLIGKDPDVGKHWGQEEKGMTEVEIVGWHHWLNGHGFEQALGGSEGQRSLVCCSPWGWKESDVTEWENNNWESEIKTDYKCYKAEEHHKLHKFGKNPLFLTH